MFEDSRGSATMIAGQRETAGACAGTGNAAPLGAADWLSLAAAPSFAIMALLTGVLGGGPPDMLCSAAQDAAKHATINTEHSEHVDARSWFEWIGSLNDEGERP